MKKFIVIYHAPDEAARKMADVTPEDAKKGMEPWMKWAEECGDGLVDMGTPLGNGKAVTKDGVSGSKKEVVGYSVLQANSLDEAVDMLKKHPHLDWLDSCSVEVHECLPLPGM